VQAQREVEEAQNEPQVLVQANGPDT